MTTEPYTPTLDEARGRYSDGAIHQGVPGEHLDAFDRLIAQVRRDAARAERARIVSEVRMWAGINLERDHTDEAVLIDKVAGDIKRLPEVTP